MALLDRRWTNYGPFYFLRGVNAMPKRFYPKTERTGLANGIARIMTRDGETKKPSLARLGDDMIGFSEPLDFLCKAWILALRRLLNRLRVTSHSYNDA
jgi:hypothetical protein